jgi:hypothetical protein
MNVRMLACVFVELKLRRRHCNNAVYSALDIVYYSVVNICLGRYLLVPLLLLRKRSGVGRKFDDRIENRKDVQGVRE